MTIAEQLRLIAAQVDLAQVSVTSRGEMIDNLCDLHNDLMDWALDTDHADAALEVMAILEQHIQRTKGRGKTQAALTTGVISEAMPAHAAS